MSDDRKQITMKDIEDFAKSVEPYSKDENSVWFRIEKELEKGEPTKGIVGDVKI